MSHILEARGRSAGWKGKTPNRDQASRGGRALILGVVSSSRRILQRLASECGPPRGEKGARRAMAPRRRGRHPGDSDEKGQVREACAPPPDGVPTYFPAFAHRTSQPRLAARQTIATQAKRPKPLRKEHAA